MHVKDKLNLPIKSLSSTAKLPCYAHEGDAGMDLVSNCALDINPGQRAMVNCGFSMVIPDGYCGLVLPRSGLAAKHGITVLNSPGLIDSGYRGEICVVLQNTDKDNVFHVDLGMRIAQIMIVGIPDVILEEVDQLDITSRNEDGFGSSGV